MGQKRHAAEQVISKLRIAEVETSKGPTFFLVCRKFRWRHAGQPLPKKQTWTRRATPKPRRFLATCKNVIQCYPG